MRTHILLSFLAACTGPALAADWCDRADPAALNRAEATICATPDLRALDANLGAVFYRLRDAATGTERSRLEREQFRTWLPFRDICADNRACLHGRYRARIAELTGNFTTALPAFEMLPDGKIKTTQSDGITSIFDPTTGRTTDYYPDGRVRPGPMAVQVGTLDLPSLPGSDQLLSQNVALRVRNMSRLFFDEDQRALLAASEPDQFLDYVKYYVGAVNHVLSLQQ